MRRSLWIGGGVVLALGLGMAGTTAYSGARAQQVAQGEVRALRGGLAATPYARVIEDRYQRGLFESTEDLTLGLGPRGADELRVTVHNRILHGPLPGLRGMGQAIVETELRWPPEIQRRLDAAFGGKQPTIRTVVGLDGASTTALHVPAGRVQQDGGTLTFAALDGTYRQAGGRSDLRLAWPDLRVSADGDDLHLSGLRLSASSLGPAGGHSRLTVETLEIGGASPVTVRGLSASADTSQRGNALDFSLRYALREAQADGQSLGASTVTLALRHLDRPSLEALGGLQGRLQGQRDPEALWPEVAPALEGLLRGAPELAVEDLALDLPQGQLTASARLSLDDPQTIRLPRDLTEGAAEAFPAALLTHLHLRAHLEADATLAQSFAGGLEELQDLQDQGFLRRDGDTLKGDAEFTRGQLTVNGKPVPLD